LEEKVGEVKGVLSFCCCCLFVSGGSFTLLACFLALAQDFSGTEV
jgi:hypothetical protein